MREWINKCLYVEYKQYRLHCGILDKGLWPWKLDTNYILYIDEKVSKPPQADSLA